MRVKGWTAPHIMAKNLLRMWQNANSAELSLYRYNRTGNERIVAVDLESRVSGALGYVGLSSVRERVADGANCGEGRRN